MPAHHSTPNRVQPAYYGDFRCIGDACEDNCCIGWRIPVDKETYEKYQSCSHPDLQVPLQTLVTIATIDVTDDKYAYIDLHEARCPFLAEQLCSIQAKLGEDYLSKVCATYPRVMNLVDGVIERSLDLSCPEAARLVINDPGPLRLIEISGEGDSSRVGGLGKVDALNSKNPAQPFVQARELRRLMISVLQNRTYPMVQRLKALGRLCDQFQEHGVPPEGADIATLTAGAEAQTVTPQDQFEMVMQMILRRIGSAFTSSRFVDCYREFMEGLGWVADSDVADVVTRHRAAFAAYYRPFFCGREYMLENYAASYAFRNLFPFGSQHVNREFSAYNFDPSICNQYRLLLAQYLIMETLLVGIAAYYREAFGSVQAIKLIQSSAKTFEHSISFPGLALEILDEKGFTTAESMGALLLR